MDPITIGLVVGGLYLWNRKPWVIKHEGVREYRFSSKEKLETHIREHGMGVEKIEGQTYYTWD
jgi:hypothetical protein